MPSTDGLNCVESDQRSLEHAAQRMGKEALQWGKLSLGLSLLCRFKVDGW
jgi:hypothetical protein